jgi:lipoyl(octanoyl) transferase
MEHKVIFKDLGIIRFQKAWYTQKNLFEQIREIKNYNDQLPVCEQTTNYQYLLFCEHPHVYTLGKSGSEENLLVNKESLSKQGAEFFRIDRGGDITYHGPGQIVGYPVFNLEAFSLGIKEYIFKLEETIIQTLNNFGISGQRLTGATGVWLDPEDPQKARKICAIGVKASRFITMHGFAFNVNTDLNYYKTINPCGFIDKGVTSMQKELGKEVDMKQVKTDLLNSFETVFGISFNSA